MLTAKDIMTRKVITVKKNTPISELSKLFLDNKINGVPVVDDEEKLIGIVTQGDLIEQNKNLHIPTVITLFDAVLFLESEKKFEADVKKLTGTQVEDIYHSTAVSVSPETEVGDIATLMAEKDIHTIPVLEGDHLVGIIGKRDIIRAFT
ncbi:MAG: CBS domain-containing protein [Nitrospinaceae bacterium]